MTHQSFTALLFATVCATLAVAACGDSADDASQASDAGPSATIADAAASRDGAVVQCQADHQESLEERNDRIINEANQVEPTGLVLSRQGGFSLCGQLDPAQESGDFADVDVYEFAVSGDQPVRIVLTVDGGVDLSDVQLLLLGADGPTTISEAMLIGDTGLTHRVIPAGTYWVAVLAKTPLGSSTVPYQIQVRPEPINCDDQATEGDYIESLDGQDHRGNDTLEIDYDRSSSFSETSYENDSPEPTSFVLEAGEQASIRGLVADVDALDDYRDRDAFLVRTGAQTRELSIRGAWQHNASVDLDLHVFRAGAPGLDLSFRGAATVGTGSDELATMGVEPDSDYWIWVGAYDNSQPELPLGYDITLCASDF
tara:strand:- start:32422 stop:33531 length:1110 start_codon:yes stop_codon:yes gene_type:complete